MNDHFDDNDFDAGDDYDDVVTLSDPDDADAWSLSDLAASADLGSIRDAVPARDPHAERWDI